MAVSREEVIWAYRMILGREPESEDVISSATRARDLNALRAGFLTSPEFRSAIRRPPMPTLSETREDHIRMHITKAQLGIEIGAWFNPLVPRAEGFNSLSLDVYSHDELVQRATEDPNIDDSMISKIEMVDFIGSAGDLETLIAAKGLAGKLDYIISAHNFEHLPNPIEFLRGCSRVLKPGGVISMAIPDRRTCFDYFRSESTTGQMLEAYWRGDAKPTAGVIFDHFANFAENVIEKIRRSGWSLNDGIDGIQLANSIEDAYALSRSTILNNDTGYVDAHCWTFTPESFRTVFLDLCYLDVIQLNLINIVVPNTHEFFVHIMNDRGTQRSASDYHADRTSNLLSMTFASAVNAPQSQNVS